MTQFRTVAAKAKRSASHSVLLARSGDEGKTWSTTVVAEGSQADGPEQIELNFEPHVAIDPDDPRRVVVMWRRSYPRIEGESRPTRPWMALSDDGGESFDEPFMMLDENSGFDAPRPVFAGGRLFAFYRVSASEDDEPTRLFSAVTTDGGQTWEETEIISAADASEPVPLYDGDRGVFHVVWHDNRNGDLDVFYATSQDGSQWSEPQRLNDDKLGNFIGQYYPQAALSPGGRVDVAWYDYRDDPNARPQPEDDAPLSLGSNMGKVQNVYLTSSMDGGANWSDNVRVNDVPIDRSIGTWNRDFFVVVPVSVTSWDDSALVSWSDTRLGNADTSSQDIFASRVVPAQEETGSQLGAWMVGGIGLLLGAGLALLAAVMVMRRSRETATA